MSTEIVEEETAPENFVLTSGGERLIGSSSDERDILSGLYDAHDKLSVDPEGKKSLYQKLLDATKLGKKAKVLAANFIPKFCKHFPSLGPTSIDALLDLVEDDDKQVRMASIQYLPDICEGNKRYVVEIANVLGQLLLGCDSEVELGHVESSLEKLLKSDFSGTIEAMFEHVSNGFKVGEKEDSAESQMAKRLSQKSLQFIMERVVRKRGKYKDQITPEVERAIREKVLPLLVVCDSNTFSDMTFLLQRLKIHDQKDATIYSEFVQTVIQKSNLHTLAQSFQPQQKDELRKLLNCMKLSFPLYEMGYSNDKFLRFLVIKVIPQIPEINDDLLSLEILHTLAEMSKFTNADDSRKMVNLVYNGLLGQLPNAPNEEEEGEAPVVNFSYLEAFLVIFHHIGHKVPGMLNKICGISIYTGQPDEVDEEDHSSKRLELRAKLQYAVNKAKEFRKANLEQLIRVAKPDENRQSSQTRMKTNKVISNVIMLGENLKKNNPRFDIPIVYSWNLRKNRGKKRNRRKMKDQKVGKKRKAENSSAQGAPNRKRKRQNQPPPQQRRNQGGRRRFQGNSRPGSYRGRGRNVPPPPPPQRRRGGGGGRRRDRGPSRRRSPPRGGVAEMRAGGKNRY